tara:strand:- start:3823 stop:4998 length:1176 start_codon:yes stop_codon:yes gene_type:complete
MKKTYLIILLNFFFLQAGNNWVVGMQNSSAEKEIQREKKELERIKSKLGAESEKIKKEAKREKSFLGQLKNINKTLKVSQRELTEHEKKLESTNKNLKKIEFNLNKNRKKIKIRKKLLQKRLSVIYRQGEPSYIRVVFSASDTNDFLQRLKYMKIIASYDAELISQYKLDMENLTTTKKELQETAKMAALFKDASQKKKNEILIKKRKKQEFVNKIRTRKSTHIKIQAELLEASKELSSLIVILEKNYFEEKNITFHKRKGFLPWPVRGKVISSYGKVKNKRFKTFSYNNGIEIAVAVGKSVRAVHKGEVLYSGNLKGYGLIVILGHGKGFYTLYAHLSKSLVKKGDRVIKSQVFAQTGDSDSINGPSLYFEIRNKRAPENPLKWLSVAKK